jgi:hypothetical protein
MEMRRPKNTLVENSGGNRLFGWGGGVGVSLEIILKSDPKN